MKFTIAAVAILSQALPTVLAYWGPPSAVIKLNDRPELRVYVVDESGNIQEYGGTGDNNWYGPNNIGPGKARAGTAVGAVADGDKIRIMYQNPTGSVGQLIWTASTGFVDGPGLP